MQTYTNDVLAATLLFISNKQTSEQFALLITSIARNHGIVDWERKPETFEAMGRGLHQAGIAEDNITQFPYFQKMTGDAEYAFVLKGYHKV
jgi:hypothetical protein